MRPHRDKQQSKTDKDSSDGKEGHFMQGMRFLHWLLPMDKTLQRWFTQDLRMKTGISGFIASQDAVIVIDDNRKRYLPSLCRENRSPQRWSAVNGLPGECTVLLRAMSDVTEIPRPWSHRESGSPVKRNIGQWWSQTW